MPKLKSCLVVAFVAPWLSLAPSCVPHTISLLEDEAPQGQALAAGMAGSAGSTAAPAGQGGRTGMGAGGTPTAGQGTAASGGGHSIDDPFGSPFGVDGGGFPQGPRCRPGIESVRCDPGFHCDESSMTCVVGCLYEAHCVGLGVCEWTTGRCVQCREWNDCFALFGGAQLVCDERTKTCRSCDERHPCPFGVSCSEGLCNLSDLEQRQTPGPGGGPPPGSEPDASARESDPP